MTEADNRKLEAEIAALMAQAAKASKEARWYEITIAIAATLAVVAVAKLFL